MECPENYVPIIPLRKKITGKWVGLILSRNQCQTMVSVFIRLHVCYFRKLNNMILVYWDWDLSLCRSTLGAGILLWLYMEAHTAPFGHSCNRVTLTY